MTIGNSHSGSAARKPFNLRFASLADQARRYCEVVHWFFRDAYLRFRGSAVLVLLLTGIALVLQIAALGVLFRYAKALEANATFTFRDMDFVARESVELLLLAGFGILLLFASSFAAGFAARIQALRLGRLYEELCAKRAIVLCRSRAGSPAMAPWAPLSARLLNGDPRLCGRIARIAIDMVMPAVSFLAMTAILLYVDWGLTLILLLLVCAVAPFLYSINVRGARNSTAMEAAAPAASAARRGLAEAPYDDGADGQDASDIERAFRRGPVRDFLDGYAGRLRATEEAALAGNILLAVAAGLILLQKGAELLIQGEGWGELAVYMIALRASLGSLTKVMRNLTAVNRFYPQLARYMRFVLVLENVPPAPREGGASTAPGPAEFADDMDEM